MGTTAASLHVLIAPGPQENAAAAVRRAYAQLGFVDAGEGAPGARRVVLEGGVPGSFLSVYDSENDKLDAGDLRELAVILSRELRTVALVTSVYDSDAFMFLLYSEGKQVDGELGGTLWGRDGMRTLAPAARPAKWRSIFAVRDGTAVSTAEWRRRLAIETKDETFAESLLGRWCAAAGLDPGRAAANLEDFEGEEATRTTLSFKGGPRPRASPRSDRQTIGFHRSDDCAYLSFFPAAWPAHPDRVRRPTWFVATAGPGFRGLRLRLDFDERTDAVLESAAVLAQPFFNGQITSFRAAAHHSWAGLEAQVAGGRVTKEAPDFALPPTEPETRKQFLLLVQLSLRLAGGREATVVPTVESMDDAFAPTELPPLRLRAVEPSWIPIRGASSGDLALRFAEPAVASHAAIFPRAAEAERARVQALFETWLGSLSLPAGMVASVRTEKHMTAKGNASKNTWDAPAANLLADKRWRQLFTASRDYRSVAVDLTPTHAFYPIAGAMMNGSHRDQTGESLSCAVWSLNEPEIYRECGTSPETQEALFAAWLMESAVVQAWIVEAAWFPEFGPTPTLYESAVPRITYNALQLANLVESPSWSARRLRFVGRRLWLDEPLAAALDLAAVERSAHVRRHGTLLEITARDGVALGELERVLAPILPSNDDVVSALEMEAENERGARPEHRAWALATIGTALSDIAAYESGTEKLERAIAVVDEALALIDGPSWPQGFAAIENIRTTALMRLGARTGAIEPFQAAVVGQRRAVAVLGEPLAGANPGHGRAGVDALVLLGSALVALCDHEPGTASLEEAVSLFELALRECSDEEDTSLERLGIVDETNKLRRATLQARLGLAQLALAARRGDRAAAGVAVGLVEGAQATLRGSINGKAAGDFEAWSDRVSELMRRFDHR